MRLRPGQRVEVGGEVATIRWEGEAIRRRGYQPDRVVKIERGLGAATDISTDAWSKTSGIKGSTFSSRARGT